MLLRFTLLSVLLAGLRILQGAAVPNLAAFQLACLLLLLLFSAKAAKLPTTSCSVTGAAICCPA
jgi:hypothetical protein